ncbi:hypothetical protein LZ31DRAFT_267529 [Colletotrichum somersetense]|nr:hypothetical protein LZ31DRAFT_267529 [Colletotrichum somersetense]
MLSSKSPLADHDRKIDTPRCAATLDSLSPADSFISRASHHTLSSCLWFGLESPSVVNRPLSLEIVVCLLRRTIHHTYLYALGQSGQQHSAATSGNPIVDDDNKSSKGGILEVKLRPEQNTTRRIASHHITSTHHLIQIVPSRLRHNSDASGQGPRGKGGQENTRSPRTRLASKREELNSRSETPDDYCCLTSAYRITTDQYQSVPIRGGVSFDPFAHWIWPFGHHSILHCAAPLLALALPQATRDLLTLFGWDPPTHPPIHPSACKRDVACIRPLINANVK